MDKRHFSTFDHLIFLALETDSDREEVVVFAEENFSLFERESDCFNDKYITPYNLEKYVYSRGLGLSLEDVANSIGWSATLLSFLFKGHRLSLDKLIEFAQAEVFAIAQMKREHLAVLEKAEGSLSSVTFLEKVYSGAYGAKQQVVVNSAFEQGETTEDKWKLEVHHIKNTIKEKAKASDDCDQGQDTTTN